MRQKAHSQFPIFQVLNVFFSIHCAQVRKKKKKTHSKIHMWILFTYLIKAYSFGNRGMPSLDKDVNEINDNWLAALKLPVGTV